MAHLKQSKSRLWLIAAVAFVVLLLLFGSTLFQTARSLFLGGPLVSETYCISDTSKVDQISICHGQDSVLINRTAQGWSVNGRAASGAMVSNLLSAFQSIDVYSPIPKMVDSVVASQLMSETAIAVRFGNASEPIRKIRFAYTDTLGLGTVALADGYSTGAVVRTPKEGIRLVDLLSANPSFWANTRIITASESEISEIAFKNSESPDSSFTIKRNGVGFQLLDEKGMIVSRKLNPMAISRYFNYVTRITTLSVANQSAKLQAPLYSLSIKSVKGTTVLDFIPIPSSAPLDVTGRKARFDYDRLFILMNGKDLYTANWVDVDLTIKKLCYFCE